MNQYSSYKDSGVEWIGEIPSEWEISKLSFYCEVKDGTHSTPKYVDEGFPLITQKDITYGRLDFTKTNNISEQDYIEINKRSNVVYGDIIMSMIGSIGNPTIVDTYTPFSIKNVCLFKTSDSNEITKYVLYFLNSSVLTTELDLKSRGGVQGFVSLDVLRNIRYIKPPLSEQQQIVSYLDNKTSSIDSLIQSKEKKIELLKEKRTSLINQVVTKGLNPDVEMKDSGVEWIGEIPREWISTKFNRFVFFQEGPGLRTYQFTESGTKVICVTNITENGIDFSYEKFISTEEYLEKYQHFTVEKGDLLLSSSGNSWGKVSEYVSDEKVMLNTSTIRLNTLDEKFFSKNLISHLLKSDLVRKQLEILMTGSCQPNFGPSHLNQLIIPLPPLSEQHQIVSYLDNETKLIDETISSEEKKIELLKEYKQSLISEVVTGKRKVVLN